MPQLPIIPHTEFGSLEPLFAEIEDHIPADATLAPVVALAFEYLEQCEI